MAALSCVHVVAVTDIPAIFTRAEPQHALAALHSRAAGRPTTPAMAAGVERAPWSVFQIAELLD